MKRNMHLMITALFCGLILCGKKKDEGAQALVRVGNRTYTRDDYGDFSSMMRFFPLKNPSVFPGQRKSITSMIETDLLYAHAPAKFKSRSLKNTADWRWRERYYQAQIFMSNILARNLGFSDKEIESYYNAHREDSFKSVVKVPTGKSRTDSTGTDSTNADSAATAQTTRDSVFYRPLAEVRDRIVKNLFLSTYQPDSAFMRRFFGDSLPDSSTIREQWYRHVSRHIRTRDQDFFLTRYYAQYYGTNLPDSIPLWFGDGKVVTPADLETILAWLPVSERGRYSSERGRWELARWVLRWKIFSQKAAETGFVRHRDVRKALAWAWKFHVVNQYLDEKLIPKLRGGLTVDTALCTFSTWDEYSRVQFPPDSAALAHEIQNKLNRAIAIRLDSIIYAMRLVKGVTFLQNDFRDDKDQPPAVILARADSLRDSDNATQAEQEYRKLTTDYPFTAEGATAFSEVAKLLMERQSYRDAIRNYRLQLFHTSDSSRMCNTYFMIGFIYDEHLNMPELAEVNYKWVLKNMSYCELADDAEFMMLHLDEPMIRIEDLRAEALRQGRNISYDDDELMEDSSVTAKPTSPSS